MHVFHKIDWKIHLFEFGQNRSYCRNWEMWRKFPFGILYFQLRFVNHDKEFWESTLNFIIVLRNGKCGVELFHQSSGDLGVGLKFEFELPLGVIWSILKKDLPFRNQTIGIGCVAVFFIVQTKISVCLRIERIWARIYPCSISDRSLDYIAERSKTFFQFSVPSTSRFSILYVSIWMNWVPNWSLICFPSFSGSRQTK